MVRNMITLHPPLASSCFGSRVRIRDPAPGDGFRPAHYRALELTSSSSWSGHLRHAVSLGQKDMTSNRPARSAQMPFVKSARNLSTLCHLVSLSP